MHAWNQDFVAGSPAGQRYEQLADEIDRAIAFMHACGADPEEFQAVEFYSSHEALLLDYERPLTRTDVRSGRAYDLSAHLLWIGERTRAPGSAHVEFARQIRNPVAVKIGPAATAPDVLALIEALDPDHEPGRLTLITRMGAGRIRQALPPLVEKVAASGAAVVWVCDPMHGNTVEAASGHKTRYFDDVLDEVVGFFEVHRALGTHPGGIHIEFTGDDVTECIGGGHHNAESDLSHRYETTCDPRLNRSQSLDLAFRVAELYRPTSAPRATYEPPPVTGMGRRARRARGSLRARPRRRPAGRGRCRRGCARRSRSSHPHRQVEEKRHGVTGLTALILMALALPALLARLTGGYPPNPGPELAALAPLAVVPGIASVIIAAYTAWWLATVLAIPAALLVTWQLPPLSRARFQAAAGPSAPDHRLRRRSGSACSP